MRHLAGLDLYSGFVAIACPTLCAASDQRNNSAAERASLRDQ